MKTSRMVDSLWGNKARVSYLFFATFILLFTLLGSRELWTQEHRWADIVSGMFYRHDFLHPYLNENFYYDKPLLSYWLMALFAKISGNLNMWALRIPSACAGFLAIFSIYHLGSELKNKSFGLLSGWLLLTTFYFLFWARTSSTDMMNLAGSLAAIAWYFVHRERSSFFNYAIFFLIIALTSLCKGLIGAIIPLIAVFINIVLEKSWKQHFHWVLLVSVIPALIVYLIPFIASSYFGGDGYGENGLYLVYRENILRYFQPFDHKGPLYTYFLFLPIYLLPWAIFLPQTIYSVRFRWKTMSNNSKWIVLTTATLFLFLTLSGSRRSYYVLPIIPYAILMIADWLLTLNASNLRKQVASIVICIFGLLFVGVDILPAWYYSQFGVNQFAVQLENRANKIKPWKTWNVVMLDAESKLNFYLNLPPNTMRYHVIGNRLKQTAQSILQSWPILLNKPKNTIFISRKIYLPYLIAYFQGYDIVELSKKTNLPIKIDNNQEITAPVAFIPVS